MDHNIQSEQGQPRTVTGQPAGGVPSPAIEREGNRPAPAATGAAEGMTAAPGFSPATEEAEITASCEQALQERIEELEADLAAARSDRRLLLENNRILRAQSRRQESNLAAAAKQIDRLAKDLEAARAPQRDDPYAIRAALDKAGCPQADQQPGTEVWHLLRVEQRIEWLATDRDRSAARIRELSDDRADAWKRIDQLTKDLELARAQQHPVIDAIHAELDKVGVPRNEWVGGELCARPLLPQQRIAWLAYSVDQRNKDLEAARVRHDLSIDAIHAELDKAGVPRPQVTTSAPCLDAMMPQQRIVDLVRDRNLLRGVLDCVRKALACERDDSAVLVAKRRRKDSELLAWLDQFVEIAVIRLQSGPLTLHRDCLTPGQKLSEALGSIRNADRAEQEAQPR